MSTIDFSRFSRFPQLMNSMTAPALLAAALLGSALPAAAQTYPVNILETARTAPQEWAFTTTEPAAEWFEPAFDDAGWSKGKSGFGTIGTPGAIITTDWSGTDIWLRKTFNIKGLAEKSGLTLLMHHDENAEVYINGRKVLGLEGYSVRYEANYLDVEGVGALKEGDNVIAVHCKQTLGGQYIDVGLAEYLGGFGTDFILPSFSAAHEWRYATEDPNADWTAADFNDASWQTGKCPFGAGGDYVSSVQTAWTTEEIFMRATFDVTSAAKIDHLILGLAHDDEATIYLNGMRVAEITGYNASSYQMDISAMGKQALKDGSNVLAVRCHNGANTPQFLDVSLSGLGKEAPVSARARAVSAAGAPRFFSWRPGQARLLIGTGARRVDLSGRTAAPLR